MAGLVIETVRTLGPEHLRLLECFDASFTTDRVIAVTATQEGFRLVEQPRQELLTKRYGLPPAAAQRWDVTLLVHSGDAVVAVAATTFSAWNQRQVLDELHVAPAHRRRGVARRLLAEVCAVARANGAREIWLETQNVNVPAVRAYQRLGFRLCGVDVSRYAPPLADEVALFLARPVSGDPETRVGGFGAAG